MPPAPSTRPVFVGGCPRSGTTLLRTMLNSHPGLAIPHETRFLIEGYRRRREWGDLADPANRRRLADWVVGLRHRRYRRLSADPDELRERMAAAAPTLGSVLAAGFRLYAEQNGKTRWGDKRPSHVLNLDAVFAMFPDAQYVNIVRDPRATVASIRRVGDAYGWGPHGIAGATDTWERSQRAADHWRRRLPDDAFTEIQYERMVADPAGVLGGLVGFLGLDPAGLGAMLRHHETADVHNSSLHPLVARPLTTEALRAWERSLKRREVAFIERTLADRMERYGYEPAATGVAVPDRLLRRHRKVRAASRREFLRGRAREAAVRVAYRRPVAART